MRQFRSQMIVQCDCCGKSKMYEDINDYKKPPKDDRYTWSNIRIDAKVDQDYFLDHTIVLCPECCNKVLDAIKEKCNYFNNWPSPYKIEEVLNAGCDANG